MPGINRRDSTKTLADLYHRSHHAVDRSWIWIEKGWALALKCKEKQ
jgi:hypothetical protein